MKKIVLTAVVFGYIGAGLFGGLVMQAAIPVMNGFGVAYYAVTWPAFLHCARKDVANCNPLTLPPEWIAKHLFTFSGHPQ